jgi:hypothetical protein
MGVFLALSLVFLADTRPANAPLRKWVVPSAEKPGATFRAGPRQLSRQEILQAIQNDLARRGISGGAGLRPEDLIVQSSVPALKADLGLRVKATGYDPIRRQTVFVLWASQEPQFLPFRVSTKLDPGSLSLDATNGPGTVAKGSGSGHLNSQPLALVKPRMPATLVMLGENVRVTTIVVPLQPGYEGQVILVRDTTTARVMKAQVVGEGLLQSNF